MIGDALLGFIEQSAKFLNPVFAGDTLYPGSSPSRLPSTTKEANWS
jgi:hypothetical protein